MCLQIHAYSAFCCWHPTGMPGISYISWWADKDAIQFQCVISLPVDNPACTIHTRSANPLEAPLENTSQAANSFQSPPHHTKEHWITVTLMFNMWVQWQQRGFLSCLRLSNHLETLLCMPGCWAWKAKHSQQCGLAFCSILGCFGCAFWLMLQHKTIKGWVLSGVFCSN